MDLLYNHDLAPDGRLIPDFDSIEVDSVGCSSSIVIFAIPDLIMFGRCRTDCITQQSLHRMHPKIEDPERDGSILALETIMNPHDLLSR